MPGETIYMSPVGGCIRQIYGSGGKDHFDFIESPFSTLPLGLVVI